MHEGSHTLDCSGIASAGLEILRGPHSGHLALHLGHEATGSLAGRLERSTYASISRRLKNSRPPIL
jgi:hypothetical protein